MMTALPPAHPTSRPSAWPDWLRRAPGLAGVLLMLLAALLYFATLDNGLEPRELEGGDLITHQYAQVQARPSNSPGYPLYTMGGWLWFHGVRGIARLLGEPTPNPIPILSSYSTFWALLAIWLLFRIGSFATSTRYQPRSRWGRAGNWPLAWFAGALYAVTYFFWYYATTTEQYSSAIAQTLAILYLWLLWQEADAVAGEEAYTALTSRPARLLILLALLCGLALAHMLTVAFIVPPVVLAVLWQRPALLRKGRLLLAVVAAAALPLVSYAYVYLRGAAHPEWWGSMTFADAGEWFRWFVSTSQGRDELGWGFEEGRSFFGNGFPELIWQELSVFVLAAGLAGIALLRRTGAWVLYGTLLVYLVFCWAYRYGNWYQVILPAYPLLVLGLVAALDWVQRQRFLWNSPWRRALPLALLAAAVVWRVSASLPQADSRNRPGDDSLDRAALLLEEIPPDAALFGALSDRLALDYLISVWGLQPTARLVDAQKAQDVLRDGGRLFSTWEAAPTLLAEMERGNEVSLRSRSPGWVELVPSGAATEGPAAPLGNSLPLTDGLILEGWTTAPAVSGAPVITTAPAMNVMLWWRMEHGWPEGLHLSLRPTAGGALIPSPGGGGMLQADSAAPMGGLWTRAADPVVLDTYRVPLAQPYPQGVDGLILLLYRVNGEGFETVAEVALPLLHAHGGNSEQKTGEP